MKCRWALNGSKRDSLYFSVIAIDISAAIFKVLWGAHIFTRIVVHQSYVLSVDSPTRFLGLLLFPKTTSSCGKSNYSQRKDYSLLTYNCRDIQHSDVLFNPSATTSFLLLAQISDNFPFFLTIWTTPQKDSTEASQTPVLQLNIFYLFLSGFISAGCNQKHDSFHL